MDSIGDNVMAIICVVVGLLIIGCALVPIVDNASSTETTVVTETSGYNTLSDNIASSYPDWWLQPVEEIVISVTDSGVIMNDEDYVQDANIFIYPNIGSLVWATVDVSANTISVRNAFGTAATLTSGTISFANGNVTIAGSGSDGEYQASKSTSKLMVTANGQSFTADPTTIYGISSTPVTIGEGQYVRWFADIITTESTTLPEGVTMQTNSDGTATISWPADSKYYAPYKWEGSITTTTTEESEYANLYAMIPVLCILGMAYVLIRRFY